MARKIRHTYGEAYTIVKMNMRLVNGRWKSVIKPPHFQKMKRVDAGAYYNKKLKEYWHNMLKNEIKDYRDRERVIKAVSSNSIDYRRFCFNLKRG